MPDPASTVQPDLSIEDVARQPSPGMAYPTNIAFHPDGIRVTYLHSPEGSLIRRLFVFDPECGAHSLMALAPGEGITEENVSLEEALRRERIRQSGLGIAEYQWSEAGGRLLIPLQGDLWTAANSQDGLRRLASGGEMPIQAARFSPDGGWVAYVQDSGLWLIPAAGGEPRQLTRPAPGSGRTHGLAEYIAQEEMHRYEGYWWSPDSRRIAFVEVDETQIPVYRIVHQGRSFETGIVQEDHHYPFAGGPNAIVRLGVTDVDGADIVWMDLGSEADIYLARVSWMADRRLAAQIQNRRQDRLDLVAFDPETGRRTLLLTETGSPWLNLHDLFKPLEAPVNGAVGGFVWGSERSGFQHLYLYDRTGALIRPLTEGSWVVEEIAGVDETAGTAYVLGTLDDPRERHLYAVPLDGGAPRRITQRPGYHAVMLDRGCRRFADIHSALDRPYQIHLCALADGADLAEIYVEPDPRLEKMDLQPPEMIELKNRHGDRLYGAVFRPPARFGPGPHPAVIYVYGGPHAQLVKNDWLLTASMRSQYLRSLGFLVFVLDNRGSARRGLSFEAAIAGDMGHAEVEDQVDGVRHLVERGLIDPQRVGIYGWSYGGYMAAMCLVRAPDTFRAAVAGAPVTHWDGYDTHYTERYMGLPQSNPEGYRSSSVMAHVEQMRGALLLVHGMIDENVHFRHTVRFIDALIAARKRYELLIFPDERHMPRREVDRVYMEARIVDFLMEQLDARRTG